MARKLSMAFLAAAVVAAFIHGSAAQTTHTVGGTTGWTIPASASVYPNWAAGQTFRVGDILVFNFANNQHDVAEVSKADYDACTSASPIQFVATSPARITINAIGEHYFLCNFTGHCSAGQKLMINVSAATTPAPAPQPSSPSPSPSPSPQSSAPTPVPASPPTPVSTPAPSSTPTSPSPTSGTPPPSPTPPSSPSPSGTTAPPPPPSDSSAKSLGVAAGLSATFLSIAVALLY